MGLTDLVLERTSPEEHPESEKNRASLANTEGHSACKPKNTAIRSLK